MKLSRDVAMICPLCEDPLDIYQQRGGDGYKVFDGRCDECEAYVTILVPVNNPPDARDNRAVEYVPNLKETAL